MATAELSKPVIQPGEKLRHYASRVEAFMKLRPSKPLPTVSKYKLQASSGAGAVVSTVAGSDVSGFRDGTKSEALFLGPSSLCVDDNYNVYVFDQGRIRKISPNGSVRTIAGTGDIFFADEVQPPGLVGYGRIAVDSQENIYQADVFSRLIRKIDKNGVVTDLAGTGTRGVPIVTASVCLSNGMPENNDGVGSAARFGSPEDITLASDGALYVPDFLLGSIRKISPINGAVSTVVSPIGCLDSIDSIRQSPLNGPYEICSDANGAVFSSDTSPTVGTRVTQVVPTIEHKFDGLVRKAAIAMDNSTNLYTMESFTSLVRYSVTGSREVVMPSDEEGWQDGPAGTAQLTWARDIACDKDGNVYIAEDYIHFGVRKITLSSSVLLEAREPAFSPNGDGRFDVDGLKVTANGVWEIRVKDHPGVLGGVPAELTGTKEFEWNGKVGGIQLDDGKYTIEVQSGPEKASFQVIIDTTAPAISDMSIEPFTDRLGSHIKAKVIDEGGQDLVAGVKVDDIKADLNLTRLDYGVRTYDGDGVFKLTLNESDVVDHEISELARNTLTISAEDSVGNQAQGTIVLDENKAISLASTLDRGPGFGLASVQEQGKQYKLQAVNSHSVFYPLLGHEIEFELQTSGVKPNLWAVCIFPPNSRLPISFKGINSLIRTGIATWIWTPRIDKYRPVPSGLYTAKVFMLGSISSRILEKFEINNAHVFDWFTNPINAGNRVKVIWGRPNSVHHLEYFNSIQTGVKTPANADRANELLIWNALLPYFQDVVGSGPSIKFENIRLENPQPSRQSLDVFYRAQEIDIHGTPRTLELQMNRRLENGSIKETPTSAYEVI